ncbi:biotin/lipoyl-binding protein, partial [Bacteroidales bacterium MSK.15.36]|nr:biotin/lipoyl-binding protein [Bacteroidales bacterium MSK.15.36]
PGTVAKILVEPGAKVKAKETVAIIEAMKMETNVTSPVDGTVKSIIVKEGQNVESGELLIRLD